MSTLIVFVSLLGLLYASSTMATVEVKQSRRAVDDLRSSYLAEAGVERALLYLRQVVNGKSTQDPMPRLTALFAGGPTISPFVGEPVLDGPNRVGSFSVSMTSLSQSATSITIAIDSTGYLPEAPSALAPGEQVKSWHALRTTVRYSLAPSEVFDYAYFINNWGWFYGDTINCYGNARSNGQFDVAGYQPLITGQPLYDGITWNGAQAALTGYHDDNGDGLNDGNDGGVFSGWDIVGAQNLRGNGGQTKNQHDFQGSVGMPNLTDLTAYEARATEKKSTITIGGVQVCDAVYGDGPGELQNLYLVGTLANPIKLNGPVVVRGNVMISGYVTGQGAIYSGGNAYCPNSISYVNAPTSKRPANNTQAATEAWMSANAGKDFLGLFAKENVVVGDTSNWIWQYYTNWWMSDAMNSSVEDAGADGIPNTRAGRDGIMGTADDDVLEGDGVFTIQHYTAQDLALGLIPAGKSVGDPIPGTGEDIDGDGVYDPGATLSNVVMSTPLDTANWGGNMPAAGIANYSDIATLYASNLDAVLYTNHSMCWVVLGGTSATINGAVVSRNENMIYGTPTLDVNQDCRLLGGSTGMAAGLLPSTMKPVEIVRWLPLDNDPNRYLAAP